MLLVLKTLTRRIALPFALFLVWTPVASAWSWPVQGPVLQPFSYDESHAYAAGQHRGIDIGADAAGQTVVAPAAGTVTFAGTVPTNGQSVTIGTADGYSVTLTHLGSILVAKGATVAEHDPVGTIGPSGTPEASSPYVHLGIRVTGDPNGYVDPLGLLPPAAESGGTESDSTASQPSSSSAPASPPASIPASSPPARPSVATTHSSTPAEGTSHRSVHEHERAQESRSDAKPTRASQAPASHAATPGRHLSRPASSPRRPVVETSAPVEPAGLDAGHEIGPSAEVPVSESPRRRAPSTPLALVLNGAAALAALGAALAAGRRRRRRAGTSPVATAQVLRLPEAAVERRRAA
jgi:peptidase M23-like protein